MLSWLSEDDVRKCHEEVFRYRYFHHLPTIMNVAMRGPHTKRVRRKDNYELKFPRGEMCAELCENYSKLVKTNFLVT